MVELPLKLLNRSLTFNVREAERQRQFNDFIDKKDTILSGIVKRLEFGNVIVDLGKAEGIIQKNEMIPRENIKAGDSVKAFVMMLEEKLEDNKFFYQELIQNLWKNYLFKKFQKFMMD